MKNSGMICGMDINPWIGPSVDFTRGRITVSENGRFLQHADGTPFFFLGDTAWELFHRFTMEKVEYYLENRRQKGFTVVKAVILSEFDGLKVPNAYGDFPLHDMDPERPNEAYFKHIDSIVELARQKGLYVGILPTWGDKVISWRWGTGPIVFNENNARTYGAFLGKRYKDKPNIIWILGGDRPPTGVEDVWRNMAAGLAEGDGGNHLITYHPVGERSSSLWFHNEPWLDFNMLQSGHFCRDFDNYSMISYDYGLLPAKPCMDCEPRYEDHAVNWNPENGYFDDFDVRQAAYWAVFAGAHGHTYGCHDVWQMYEPPAEPITHARIKWTEALELPGAWSMLHLRRLMESRPFFDRIPDQSVVAAGQGSGEFHVQATRSINGGYAFVYTPVGRTVIVDMGKISGTTSRAWWFNPRNGTSVLIGEFQNSGFREFTPPTEGRGNDWVLVLDDKEKGYQEAVE